MADTHEHDPNAVLDNAYDWTAWLSDGETITSHTVTVVDGTVAINSTAVSGGVVTAWVSGGTAPENARVTCHIVTDQGREDDRSIILKVRER